MTEAPDEAVVARVLSGRRDDFGVLVGRYQDQMLAYVRYAGFGPSEAADIVQDAFVRAYRHLGRCGEPERFAGWLFRIVRNLCHSARSRNARRRTEPLEPHGQRLESQLPRPDECLEAGRLKERVREALDAIPDDQREALILMYLQGYSVGEIAALAGTSASAVKMRLKRGREALKSRLATLEADWT
jgi:RNA polymerase sigma-70 factor (ECF subfamily)